MYGIGFLAMKKPRKSMLQALRQILANQRMQQRKMIGLIMIVLMKECLQHKKLLVYV